MAASGDCTLSGDWALLSGLPKSVPEPARRRAPRSELGDDAAALGALAENGFFLALQVPGFSVSVAVLPRLPGAAVLPTAPPPPAFSLGALADRRCDGNSLSVLRLAESLAAALAAVIVAPAPELARRAGRLCLPFFTVPADADRAFPGTSSLLELVLPKACAAELLVEGACAMEFAPAEPRRAASKAPLSATSRAELPPARPLSSPLALVVGGAAVPAEAAATAAAAYGSLVRRDAAKAAMQPCSRTVTHAAAQPQMACC